ncbi:MAG: DUF3035 domain-containing protein [Proteobacteria bacterium]|nr:DUF3035 domain-containing protein [Pseudomonadota bacterium]MBI3495746.1 DUF3035 domain-containing protein [Pseudomonadota bacterium]
MTLNPRVVSVGAVLASLALAGCADDARKMLGLGKNAPDEFQVVAHAPLSIPPDSQLRPPTPGASRPQEASPSLSARAAVLGNGSPAPVGTPQPTAPASGNTQTASVASDPPPPSSAPRNPVSAMVIGGAAPTVPASANAPGVLGRSAAAPAGTPSPAAAAQPADSRSASGEQALLSRLGADKALPNIRSVLTEELTQLAAADEPTINKLLWWRKPEAPAKILDASKESQRLQENAALGKPATEGETPSIKRVGKSIFENWF